MKKITPILYTLFAMLYIFAPLAKAESDENVTKRRPERAVEIQEIRQDRRDTVREKVQEVRSNIAGNHASRLERRFTFYYSRLNNIITRFESRLELLAGQGKDVSVTQAKLDASKTKLEAAKAKGDEAIAAFQAIEPARFSEQKDEAFAARDLAKEARQLFKDAHTLLKDALKSLKTISKPALPASSAAVN